MEKLKVVIDVAMIFMSTRQGPGKLENIGWAKSLIFVRLLGISNFLGSIIDVFISILCTLVTIIIG